MGQLVAIAYADETLAGRAAEEVSRCADDLLIDSEATSVAICERDGSVALTTSSRPGATAHWSRFWSVLLGAVMSDGAQADALDRSFSRRLRDALQPGCSVLLIALLTSGRAGVLEMLSSFEGRPIACTLPDDLPRRWGIDGLSFDPSRMATDNPRHPSGRGR